MECHLCCQPCGFFFFFFLKEHLKPAVWDYRSLSSFHSYCSLKFHMLSWVELRGRASPLRMIDSETYQSRWAKHASTTAIFARAPISRVYKKHFYGHFEEYRITDFMETAEFGKKKHLYTRLRCFFFLSFSESEPMRKTFDGNRSAESTHLTWLISCLRCLHYNHCITSLSNFGSTTEQAAIFEKRLTFKHCLFEQCGRALPLVYMYTLFKVIKSKSYFESRTRVVSPCPLSCLTDSRTTKCSSFKGTYLFQPLLYHRILFCGTVTPAGRNTALDVAGQLIG